MSKDSKAMLEKFKEVLGENNSKLMVLKGRLLNITKNFKRGSDEEYYYHADIKVLQNETEGYNASFDMFNLVFPVVVSMALTDAELKEMKNNEVIVLVVPSCRIRTKQSETPDENGELRVLKYNNCSFFVADIMQTAILEKQEFAPTLQYNL